MPRPAAEVTKAPVKGKDLDNYLRASAEADADPDGDSYLRIIDQVLSATSVDVVLTPVEAMQAKDMTDIPLYLAGFDLNKSEYDVGSPFYVSMQCMVAQDGTPVVINCGHRKVIAQCVKLRQFDQFPYQVQIRARGASAHGTPMLELIKWADDAEPPPF